MNNYPKLSPALLRSFIKQSGESAAILKDVSILASSVNHLFPYASPVPTDPLRNAISSQVARLLKEERESQGLSLNLLAERAGLSRQTVSYVEQETQNPTLDTLLRITWALQVDLETIISRARMRAVAKAK